MSKEPLLGRIKSWPDKKVVGRIYMGRILKPEPSGPVFYIGFEGRSIPWRRRLDKRFVQLARRISPSVDKTFIQWRDRGDEADQLREALEEITEVENTRIECRCVGTHDEDMCLYPGISLDAYDKAREIAEEALR